MEKRGIDISYYQGDINFEELKGNIDFAIVRTSYGNFYEDEKYRQNIEGLESIGVPYGVYHYSYASSVESAKEEATKFINLVKNYKPLYPVVVDIESNSSTQNLSSETLVDIAVTFCETIEDAGYYAMIYSNLNFFNTKLNSQELDKYDKWLAQWASRTTYDGEFGIWQYSSTGTVSGINGNVDLDIAYKDYPSIIKEKGLNNYVGKDENVDEGESTNEINYVVKKGDTLSAIASKYNTTYQKLATYNNISNPDLIYPNQIIKIPSDISITPTTYVVKKGDTLSAIASKYGTTWQKLYEKNKNIIGNNPDLIKPGQILKL